MNVADIAPRRLNLNEILDTKVKVTWTVVGSQHEGAFELEGHKYVIQLDEYELDKPLGDKTHLVDFGFKTDGKVDALLYSKNASKVIGAVMNGAMPKLKELNPELILVSVIKDTGAEESRKSCYSAIMRWVHRYGGFNYETSGWVENDRGFFKLLAKGKMVSTEAEEFLKTIKSMNPNK